MRRQFHPSYVQMGIIYFALMSGAMLLMSQGADAIGVHKLGRAILLCALGGAAFGISMALVNWLFSRFPKAKNLAIFVSSCLLFLACVVRPLLH